MRLKLLVFLVAFAIGNCTTTGASTEPKATERVELTGLQGMSLYYITQQWQKPDLVQERYDGSKIVVYKDVVTNFEDPESEKTTKNYCDVEIVLNKEELVTDWGNKNCRPYTP